MIEKLSGKKILIFQQRGWGMTIGRFLAKKLQAENCSLSAFTFKKTTHEFVMNQKEVKYDFILNNDEIMGKPKDYLEGEYFSLEEICESLGIESVWPIILSLRNQVRSYNEKYYYSFRQNISDEDIIDYVMALYKCLNYFYKKYRPDLIVAPNFVTLPHIMFNLFFKSKGVPMIVLTSPRINKDVYIFTHDYQENSGVFHERVDLLNKGEIETPNRENARKYINEFREVFKKHPYSIKVDNQKTIKQRIRHELSPYNNIAKWFFKKHVNFVENSQITIDNRPPRIILRDFYCSRRYKKIMGKFDYYPFNKIKKFIYFPLQVQPEESIDVTAPFFCNQIETARQLALSLPGDLTLVVKEHPDMVDKRPPSYMEKIARTINVKLIDYRIPSVEIIKRAEMIISPNSTTLVEASFYRKPAIQLGNLGVTMKLPNVFRHTDMTTITKKIKQLLTTNFNNKEYERKLENYIAAVFDLGLNFDYSTAWINGGDDLEILWQYYKKEIERLLFN